VPVLTKAERNALYDVIGESNFDHTEFSFTNGSAFFRLTHTPSGSFIHATTAKGMWTAQAQTGDEPQIRSSIGRGALPSAVAAWLREVEEWEETPDLWAQLDSDQAVLQAATEDPENAPFDEDDKNAIRTALNELESTAKADYSLSDQQFAQLTTGIADITEKLDRMGRREWLTYAAGMLALLQASVLPPEESRHILTKLVRVAVNAFGHRVGLPPGS
jgi:hypothetical protein